MSAPLYHLSAEVPRKSLEYLEWLGLEARTSGGLRLSKATILRALLNVAMRLEIDVSGATTQAELEERIWEAMNRARWAKALERKSAEEEASRWGGQDCR